VKAGRGRELMGALLILAGVALIAGSLALHSWGTSNPPTSSGAAPPLTTLERQSLQRDRSAVVKLPQALAEIPAAMVDASRSPAGTQLTRTQASELLFEHPELGQLLRAVEKPDVIAAPLTDGLTARTSSPAGPPLLPTKSLVLFFIVPGVLSVGLGLVLRSRRWSPTAVRVAPLAALVAGAVVLVGLFAPGDGGPAPWRAIAGAAANSRPVVNVAEVQNHLSTLEQVYDDVVPALQIAGAAGHQVLSPQSAAAVLSGNTRLVDLDRFVTDFNALYGTGILISQEAASSQASTPQPHAVRGLAWLGLIAGSVLTLLGLTWAALSRRPNGQAVQVIA
jgi:hypothetical protein